MALQVVVRAPRLWEWARSSTEDVLKLAIAYTKNRQARFLRVTVVELNLQQTIDVGDQGVGETRGYSVQFSLNRQPVSVSATEHTVSLGPGGSTTLTPPSGKAYAIAAGDCAWSVRIDTEPWPFSQNVVGAEAFTVERGQSEVESCTYYEVNLSDIIESFTIRFEELDDVGNVIDSGEASVEHAKPFQPVVSPSSVEVNWVG